jgi:8-oxo-dGTP diphosphatase
MSPLPSVDVAACIVRSGDGRVLLAQRSAGQIAPGFWELPGGKIDPGETPAQAATRELYEEVGLVAQSLAPWAAYDYAFDTKRVRLRFFRVDAWTGMPHGREGQQVAWVDPTAPEVTPILPSNDRVLLALGLPELCLVSDAGEGSREQRILAELGAAFSSGVRLVRLHAPNLAPDQRVAFARRVVGIARRFGAHVLLAGSVLEAHRAGATGVHSTAEEFRRCSARLPVRLWSVTCHSAADLAHAAVVGADVAMVQPVFANPSLPHQQTLGWNGLRALVANASLPVIAYGGVTAAMLAEARHAGAIGIAADEIDVPVRAAS